jgi:sugar lactone lactonase YvrE
LAARFYWPRGIATDSSGTIYVADTYNHTIRKITAGGVVATVAGAAEASGSLDGIGSAARFTIPQGIATDSRGSAYVADTNNHIIRKVTPDGAVATFAGSPGVSGSIDGIGSSARFNRPYGIAIDIADNIYVADTNNHTIRRITPSGTVSTLAGTAGVNGSADGIGAATSFYYPQGIACDRVGNILVAETYNHTIRKITQTGIVTTFAGTARIIGSQDGIGTSSRFFSPWGIAADALDNLYVADYDNHTIRKITPDGMVTTLAGNPGASGSEDGLGSAARFNNPRGVATDLDGNVYIADSRNSTIRKITPAGFVTTVVGIAGMIGFLPGAMPGVIRPPMGIAIANRTLLFTSANGVAQVTPLPQSVQETLSK